MYYSAVDGKVERRVMREGLQVYVNKLVFCLKGPKHEIFGYHGFHAINAWRSFANFCLAY
jgi:hypothetical protein